ncbi:hypothetical protein GOP47_0028679 [Adiantum capillus-veneris]|nr:hypothetical protein GOP47_0028679 [Adiantum capillus-veneris]
MGGLMSCMHFVEVIRLVHINGHVEEMNKPMKVEDVMRANPQFYVGHAFYHHMEVMPPDASLELGQIYFLLPTDAALASTRPLSRTASPSRTSTMSPLQTPLRLLGPNFAHSNMSTAMAQQSIMQLGIAAPPTFNLLQGERFGVAKVMSLSKKSLSDYLAELDEVKVNVHQEKSVGYGRFFAAAEMEGLQDCPLDDDSKPFWRPSLSSIAEES